MSAATGSPTWRQSLARAGYALLMRALVPLLLLKVWWRGRAEPLYRQAIAERLGLAPPAGGDRLWLHAVSLGETRAAAALVVALREQRPDLRLLLTHGTATGREAGRALLGPNDVQQWLPWDTPGAVRRFLRRQRPCVGVLMETETWPALLHAAQDGGVPVLLANARLSPKSLAGQQRLPALMRPTMGALTAAFAQTDGDAQRLHDAGVPSVEVCGNLKFDMAPDPELLARGRGWRAALGRPVVLAASTREGEEGALLACWQQALAGVDRAQQPLLLLVPRHPQRFHEVAQLVGSSGLTLARRSAWPAGGDPAPGAAAADVWLGDSIGELPLYYACADLALLGGSYGGFGGQNLIESAACGCPLLIGPSTFNFADAAERAIEAGAAQRMRDIASAISAALDLLEDGRTLRTRSEAALRFAAAHRGAARRMAAAIVRHLPLPPASPGLTPPDQHASIGSP